MIERFELIGVDVRLGARTVDERPATWLIWGLSSLSSSHLIQRIYLPQRRYSSSRPRSSPEHSCTTPEEALAFLSENYPQAFTVAEIHAAVSDIHLEISASEDTLADLFSGIVTAADHILTRSVLETLVEEGDVTKRTIAGKGTHYQAIKD
ncbi:hypothetical protein [Halogranum amylolyticum]|uniref:hypothetical protein n=1 Tax=Halogranum amylolyticum TaxID=660520 RepID=UPI000B7F98E4|nr:hypothetical protein [Halogranum amylolyticum]